MNIYFAWSIRGAKKAQESYEEIMKHTKKHGEMLSEHVAHAYKNPKKYNIAPTEKDIYQADLNHLKKAHVLVAEVSAPSHGVGWEISYAQCVKKIPVLCLYLDGIDVSAMLQGNPDIELKAYKTLKEAKKIIDDWFKKVNKKK